MSKLLFIATCADYKWQDLIANDVTELAQLVENGREITKDDFYTIANVDLDTQQEIANIQEDGYKEDILFYYNDDKNVAWYCNVLEDVEYFYV